MLLHWGILQPQGPSENLAAIRFVAPVQVRSIRIFPTGCLPFAHDSSVVARTEPSFMYLDVFFNAQSLPGPDGRPKQKPSNALVPTSLAYVGGMVEFPLDMGSEFVTRLMIIRGSFQYLSLAVYGNTVAGNEDVTQRAYEPKPLPVLEHTSLSPQLDPSNTLDPTTLARSLLSSSEAPVPLELITRLMFCLKPSNEDWDEAEFPYLYSDLGLFNDRPTVDFAVEVTARPTSEQVEEVTLKEFAANVANVFDPDREEHVQSFARLLSQCASQNSMLIQALLEQNDLQRLFAKNTLDRLTLLDLLDACANIDVAKHVGSLPGVMSALQTIRDGRGSGPEAKQPAKQILDLVHGWAAFEDTLTNKQSQFADAMALLEHVTVDELTFGTWLLTMVTNQSLVQRLADNPITENSLPHLPSMWSKSSVSSHDSFIAFVRALIGVASVVAVYAWSDSVPLFGTRAKALSLLRLWQTVDGYKEIVNHLLLIRQMTLRLECMLATEDAPPTQEGIDAEHILKAMAMQPKSFLRPEFIKVMQDLKAPLNYITDDVILVFNRVADLADGGLTSALKFLQKSPEEMDDWGTLLDTGVAVAIIDAELQALPDGDYKVFKAGWGVDINNISVYVIKHVAAISSKISKQFSLTPPTERRTQVDVAILFRTANDLFGLLYQILPTHPVEQRYLTALVEVLADVFICSDSADMSFAQNSEVCSAAHAARQRCINVTTKLAGTPLKGESPYTTSINTLKALLRHATQPGDHDVTHHMMQIFWLFDHALPMQKMDVDGGDGVLWTKEVMPHLLELVQKFYRLQEADNKTYLIRRFMALDGDVLGIAEWFVLDEVGALRRALFELRSTPEPVRRSLYHWRISGSLKILSSLAEGSSTWFVTMLSRNEEVDIALTTCLEEIVNSELYYSHFSSIVTSLSGNYSELPLDLRRALPVSLLRATRGGAFPAFGKLEKIFLDDPQVVFNDVGFRRELGHALGAISCKIQKGNTLPKDIAESMQIVLQSFTAGNRSVSIETLHQAALDDIIGWLSSSGTPTDALDSIKSKLICSGSSDTAYNALPAMDAETLTLPLADWESLLSPPPPVPSTPKRRSPAQSAEVLGLVTISPPNALLRSPEVKGLTKTYANNDFRQLRQSSATRQNTSRQPSMHVDDFVMADALASTSPPPAVAVFGSPPRPLPLDVLRGTLPMHPLNFPQ